MEKRTICEWSQWIRFKTSQPTRDFVVLHSMLIPIFNLWISQKPSLSRSWHTSVLNNWFDLLVISCFSTHPKHLNVVLIVSKNTFVSHCQWKQWNPQKTSIIIPHLHCWIINIILVCVNTCCENTQHTKNNSYR